MSSHNCWTPQGGAAGTETLFALPESALSLLRAATGPFRVSVDVDGMGGATIQPTGHRLLLSVDVDGPRRFGSCAADPEQTYCGVFAGSAVVSQPPKAAANGKRARGQVLLVPAPHESGDGVPVVEDDGTAAVQPSLSPVSPVATVDAATDAAASRKRAREDGAGSGRAPVPIPKDVVLGVRSMLIQLLAPGPRAVDVLLAHTKDVAADETVMAVRCDGAKRSRFTHH